MRFAMHAQPKGQAHVATLGAKKGSPNSGRQSNLGSALYAREKPILDSLRLYNIVKLRKVIDGAKEKHSYNGSTEYN